jgi:hypothetical protein
MKSTARIVLIIGAAAFAATAAYAAAPQAQTSPQTPKGWSYDLKNGQRVPKGNRVTNPDGSWREEVKQGNCTTVKEKSASGEYKESRQCGSASPN